MTVGSVNSAVSAISRDRAIAPSDDPASVSLSPILSISKVMSLSSREIDEYNELGCNCQARLFWATGYRRQEPRKKGTLLYLRINQSWAISLQLQTVIATSKPQEPI